MSQFVHHNSERLSLGNNSMIPEILQPYFANDDEIQEKMALQVREVFKDMNSDSGSVYIDILNKRDY